MGVALVLVFSALLSAALAHVAIDTLGDYLLAHDAYDGMGHATRSVLASLALAGAVAFAFRQLLAALDATPDGRRRAVHLARALLPRRLGPFAAGVVALAFVALCAMEALDAHAAGIPIDDPGDLLGGSIALGTITLVACAAGVAAAVFSALHALFGLTLAVARAVHALFVRRAGVTRKPLSLRRHVRRFTMHPQLARRTAKRGPPLLASL